MPMGLNWLVAVAGVVLGLLGPKVAVLGLEFVMRAMHCLQVVVAVEAELRPKVVVVDLVLGPVATLVASSGAVVAEPMVVAAGILAEPVEPKEVVFRVLSGLVAPMVVDVELLIVMAGSMGSGFEAAWVLGLDPKLDAAGVAAHEIVSRLAELVTEIVVVHKTGPKVAEHVYLLAPGALESRMVGFVGSKYLQEVEAALDYV